MRTTLFLLLVYLFVGCNQQKPQTLEEKSFEELSTKEVIQQATIEDTTVYEMPYSTAYQEDAEEYLRKNNRYKDWDINNPQRILVSAIIEKDSTASNIVVRTKDIQYPELKEEAIRLVQEAKIFPALNENGEAVRSKGIIFIHFPPK